MPTDKKPLLKTNKRQSYGATTSSSTTEGADPNSIDSLPETAISSQTITPDNGSVPLDQMKSTLSFLQRMGFGLGHVFNDLCAGVWFSYTLLFLQGALQMPGTTAGALVMVGQVGDAVATPIIGILADKYSTKRKWHIAGMSAHTIQLFNALYTLIYLFMFCVRYGSGVLNVSTNIFHMSLVCNGTSLVDANILWCGYLAIPSGLAYSSNRSLGYDSRIM